MRFERKERAAHRFLDLGAGTILVIRQLLGLRLVYEAGLVDCSWMHARRAGFVRLLKPFPSSTRRGCGGQLPVCEPVCFWFAGLAGFARLETQRRLDEGQSKFTTSRRANGPIIKRSDGGDGVERHEWSHVMLLVVSLSRVCETVSHWNQHGNARHDACASLQLCLRLCLEAKSK
jgi:hypothetical protein